MPTLLLNEDDVRRLLTMDLALDAVEQGLRKMGLDEAFNVPRSRVQTDHVVLHVMSAAAKSLGYAGAKIYATSRKAPPQFHVLLHDGKTGALLCILQADYLGQMRTGAASGIATKYMARPDATEVGLYGTGKQARTQLRAICAVRKVRRVCVYSRNEANRRAFATEMTDVCQTEVVPVDRPEKAAEDKDIIITATSSREPVLYGSWIGQGTHVNAVGSNFLGKAELDVAAVRRCTAIVVDSKDQARMEAGDFQLAMEEGAMQWQAVRELAQVVAGRHVPRKQAQDVTLFKSLGIALEDVAVAGFVYAQALAEGVGQTLEW